MKSIFFAIYLIFSTILQVVFALYGVVLATFGWLTTTIARSSASTKRPRLVIVGGGFAGAFIAKKVERHFETTLIDTKSYFEFTPSVLRVLTEPNHINAIQIAHSRYLNLRLATVLHDTVVRLISAHSLELANGNKVDFDALVLATGSSYAAPIKSGANERVFLASRGDTLASAYQTLAQSKQVLIVGGGIVGVELAAEIAEHFDSTQVTLVHSGARLMHSSRTVTSKAADFCEATLLGMGVNIVFNEKILKNEGNKYTAASGREFVADMCFLCTGITPNNGVVLASKSVLPPNVLDERGFIRVDQYLRVKDLNHVFAAGDVASLAEEKLAQNAEHAASVVVDNLLHFASSANVSQYKSYVPSFGSPIVISLGRTRGVFIYRNFTLCGFIAAIMKEIVEFKVMVAYRWRSPVLFQKSSIEKCKEKLIP